MSLIKCSECGKEISGKATVCPHCGVPLTINRKGTSINPIVIVLLIFYSIYSVYYAWQYFSSISYDVIGYGSYMVYYLFTMLCLWLFYFYTIFHKAPLRISSILLFFLSMLFSIVYYIVYLLGLDQVTLREVFYEVVLIFCDFVERYVVIGLLYLLVKKENSHGSHKV